MSLEEKLQNLKSLTRSCESAVVAFSGGVDSSVMCAVAREVLGGRAIAVTAVSEVYPPGELEVAKRTAEHIGIRHLTVNVHLLANPDFAANPPERCYHCKRDLLQKLDGVRRRFGFKCILDGTNRDDYSDFRPGIRALEEFGVRSPLAEAGLGKEEVGELAVGYGLPNAGKPANPCLASRIPFGREITPERLERIARGEGFIRSLGFCVVRVRDHGGLARIEVGEGELQRALGLREEIESALKDLGYAQVTIDPRGYREGGANLPF